MCGFVAQNCIELEFNTMKNCSICRCNILTLLIIKKRPQTQTFCSSDSTVTPNRPVSAIKWKSFAKSSNPVHLLAAELYVQMLTRFYLSINHSLEPRGQICSGYTVLVIYCASKLHWNACYFDAQWRTLYVWPVQREHLLQFLHRIHRTRVLVQNMSPGDGSPSTK